MCDNCIFAYYGDRCVRCHEIGVCLHEIVPRSKGKDWNRLENRVSLCEACHRHVHRVGTANSSEELTACAESTHDTFGFERTCECV